MRLAVVAVFKNEGPYLLEWLAHHRSIGVDHFFLYDNESDDLSQTIFDRLSTLPWVTVTRWATVEGASPQLAAYNDARGRLQGIADYAAFIDADEFLVPTADASVKDILRTLSEAHPDLGAVGVNQMQFGSNGETEMRPEPVLKRFPLRSVKWKEEAKWVKSIFKVSCLPAITSPHRSRLAEGLLYYNTSGKVLDFNNTHPGIVDHVDMSLLQINHYITKSKQEFLAKRMRGGGAGATLAARIKRYENDHFFDSRAATVIETDMATRNFAAGIDAKIRALKASLGLAGEIEQQSRPVQGAARSTGDAGEAPSPKSEAPVAGPKIPTVPHGPPEGIEFLRSAMAAATNYLEYGAGGSTVMAAGFSTLRNTVSVESDRTWLESVRRALEDRGVDLAKHHLIHADIGPTMQWGFPVNSNRWQSYYKYSVEPWLLCRKKLIEPDLVLIDGRFRVACFLATLLFARAGCVVLFDDYFDRPRYHAVEKYAQPSRRGGRLSEFAVPSQLPRDDVWIDLLAAVTDIQ